MKTVAAILARTESPSSPGRLLTARPLAEIRGRTALDRIAESLSNSERIDGIAAAVGDLDRDAEIVLEAERLGLKVHAGHPDSVLDRLRQVAENENADLIVRVNGNFPLVDPAALDRLVDAHLAEKADFSQNSHYHGIVYGLGVEIFTRRALDRVARENLSPRRKIIGSLHLLHHPEKYNVFLMPAEKNAPHLRVSVDFESDIHTIGEIIDGVPKPDNENVIDFLESRPDLVASMERVAPAEVSLEKVLLFPDKVKALRRNNCITFDETYPISVELSLTNRCNHACVWCSDAELRERLPGDMGIGTLTDIFKDLQRHGAKGIVIEGGGEPTLHKDFDRAIKTAGELGLAMGLITNGYLPIENTSRFEWIRVSLDASTRAQYRELKGVDGFDRVIANLVNMSAEQSGTTLGVGYVLTNRNDDQVSLEQLVLFLRKIGAGYLHIRPVVDHPELVSLADIGFLKKYETDHFSVNISAMDDNKDSGNSGLPCLAHSLSTVITADGSVFLCGRLNASESWEAIGNLHHETFHDIWVGRKRREQISMVSKAEFCMTHCPQCRMTKYNRLLSEVERIKTRNFI